MGEWKSVVILLELQEVQNSYNKNPIGGVEPPMS